MILADGFQAPFPELSGPLYYQCVFQFPETFLPDLIGFLRSVSVEAVQEKMDACGKLYDVWSAGCGPSCDIRRERFEAVFRTIGNRIGL